MKLLLSIVMGALIYVLPIHKAMSTDEQESTREQAVQIGYVNIRDVMANAPQIEQLQKKLSRYFEDQRQGIMRLRNELAELNNAYDELIANESSQTDKINLQRLQLAIDDKASELARKQQLMQDELNLRRNQGLAELQKLIVAMVVEVSKERHLDLVLNNTGVIFVDTRIDITAEVFKKLSEHTLD